MYLVLSLTCKGCFANVIFVQQTSSSIVASDVGRTDLGGGKLEPQSSLKEDRLGTEIGLRAPQLESQGGHHRDQRGSGIVRDLSRINALLSSQFCLSLLWVATNGRKLYAMNL
jgi:hypothetical protein